MNRLDMIIDVSHLGIARVEHVLEITRGPFVATHSAPRALMDHHRNLSEAQLDAIAVSDKLMCVNLYGGFVNSDQLTMDRLIAYVEHIRDRVGLERVSLGSNFVKAAIADTTVPCCVEDLESELFENDIRAALGGNLCRFLVRKLQSGRS